MKYKDIYIGFSEVPDEITLLINITGCPNRCPGCHSPWLWCDDGKELSTAVLSNLITANDGITCICFMGGDSEPDQISVLAKYIKAHYPHKVAWYSGKNNIGAVNSEYFDYIKLGGYIRELGPLNSKTTNQRMYKKIENTWVDITDIFWK